MEGKNKNYFFLLYFEHISLLLHLNFEFGDSLDVEFNFASKPYPQRILLRYQRHPKVKISIKNMFLLKFSFLGAMGTSEICSAGRSWMGNSITHPTSPQTQNLGEVIRRYVKNTIRKSSFYFSSPKFRTFILLL